MRIFSICVSVSLCSFAAAQSAPVAAPGLTVPSGGRPWALDEFKGQKQLVPVHSSAVQTNNHKGSNAAGNLLPFYKSKITQELDGTTARTVIHATAPVFYLRMDPDADSGQTAMAGWAIVHVAVDKDHRLLATVKFTQFTGTAKRGDTQIDARVETLPGGWIRITPQAALAPGEYALEPVMRQENAFSLSVYDFRIDPQGENDADAVQAEQPR